MVRSAFARKAYEEGSVKPTRMKGGKKAPTAGERKWMAWVADFGCVVCWLERAAKTPCAVHHLVEGGRRLGHLYTIGLCDPGHHQNSPTPAKISRHPNKALFESTYGTERELLAFLRGEYQKQQEDAKCHL
ncbi:MAG: Ref family recombination enhancement nuclease [Pseudomonadota bacterium]